MAPNDDILDLVEREHARAIQKTQRTLIIQPGALGDCLLTLPLARTLQQAIGVGGVDILGHMESLSILPERSDIHSVRSVDAIDLHRLFVPPGEFRVRDRDPLIQAFSDYNWIVSFMGEPGSAFEKNLVYTVHCSHGAEILTLDLKPPADYPHHVTAFHLEQFSAQVPSLESYPLHALDRQTLRSTSADRAAGRRRIEQCGLDPKRPVVVLHPGSGGPAKCWCLDNFLGLAERWQGQGGQVLFLIGPVEQERWQADCLRQLSACGPLLQDLTLDQTLAVVDQAAAVVANDSGIAHLAAGLGVSTLVLFGATLPRQYRPAGPATQIFHFPGPDFTERESPTAQEQLLRALADCTHPAD
jgi:ADP-heptose:LPS heptosyltransferase